MSRRTGRRAHSRSLVIDGRMVGDGGIGTYLRELVPLVVDRLGNVRITVLGDVDAWAPLVGDLDVVDVRSVSSPIYSLAQQIEIPRVLRNENAVLWVPHFDAPLLAPARLVVTIHDAFHLARPEYVNSRLRRAYAQWMYRSVVRRSRAILVPSDFTWSELERLLGRRIAKAVTTPLGADHVARHSVTSFEPKTETVTGRPYVIFVGNVKPHKNVRGLITAFRTVARRVPDLELWIVGQREGFKTPEAPIDLTGLEDRVHFTGRVSDADVVAMIRGARLLAFPSSYEGFGLPPIEAMKLGTPVLASRVASLPEVCGDAAAYCQPDDVASIASGILALHQDERLRRRLIAAGFQRASTFTWKRAADTTASVLARELDDADCRPSQGS